MGRKNENTSFICINCQKSVPPLTNGSYRNHCPYCLWSMHLDEKPGDRQSSCFGEMEPIGVEYNSKKGYQIIHKCKKCNQIKKNKIAENTDYPDNLDLILMLMTKS